MAIHVHKTLGSGLLESVYETALTNDLKELGLRVERQVGLPFVYKGILMEIGFRIDML
ncbi:hypothetical protein BH09BAC3_BH09BAC3_11390 [soil metagenome]